MVDLLIGIILFIVREIKASFIVNILNYSMDIFFMIVEVIIINIIQRMRLKGRNGNVVKRSVGVF